VKSLLRYDVIITSYGVLTTELRQLRKDSDIYEDFNHNNDEILGNVKGIYALKWNRIVLDEAHMIKNPSTDTAKACCFLRSNTRYLSIYLIIFYQFTIYLIIIYLIINTIYLSIYL
jgi:SNF2 family DNA or RNA helicase